MAKIAALTLRITEAPNYRERRDSISHDWINRLRGWDYVPLLLPNSANTADDLIDRVRADLLILTGGDDIGTHPERDVTERRIFQMAMAHSLPVLGVCRGLQLINEHFGGQTGTIVGHTNTVHAVSFSKQWQAFYGEQASVNSYHDNAVLPSGLGSSLLTAATDSDGNIEAIIHERLPIAAVMWHPERDDETAGDKQLIDWLTGRGADTD